MSFAMSKYRSTRITTVSPIQVLLQLYDGASRFLRTGIEAIEENNPGKRGQALSKAHAIVAELQASLDDSQAPELCAQLYSLYDFILDQITQANLKQDAAPLESSLNVLAELRSGWAELAEGQRGAA